MAPTDRPTRRPSRMLRRRTSSQIARSPRSWGKDTWQSREAEGRGGAVMGAREKLNAAYIGGSLVVAGVAGAMTDSGVGVLIGAFVLLAFDLHAGDIRPTKHHSRRQR